MADLLSFNISGDAFAGLDKLAASVGEGVLRATGYAGAQVFQAEVKRNTSKFKKPTGVIAKNIIVVRATEDSDSNQKQTYLVTVRTGKENPQDAYYWKWVEDGHNIVRRKPKSKTWKAHRAAEKAEFGSSTVPATPFVRPAYESVKDQALQAMRARLAEKLKEGGL